MRNLFLKLTARLIACVAVFVCGGVNTYNIRSYAQSTSINGIPAGSYIFSLENVSGTGTLHMADVYYSTATQSNVNAKSLHNSNDDLVYYYVPEGEAPVSFMILPNINYGFESAENLQTGATYSVNPQHVIIKASDLAVDQECRIKLNLIENVRKGRLTVLVDDPTDIVVQNRGNGLLNTITSSSFTKVGDKYECTINYSPESEKIWSIALKSGTRIFKTTLDGTAQSRTNIFIYDTPSKATLLSGYMLNLTSDKHTVDITTIYPDLDFPVTFKMVQDGGNETSQAKLDEKIEAIKIDGVVLDRSEWEGGKTFIVHNGSNLVYTLASQVRSQFEVKDRVCNGISFGSSNSIIMESEAPGSYEIEIKALINNPVRFKVRAAEEFYDKFSIDASNYYFAMQNTEEDFILDYKNKRYFARFYPNVGYMVSKVTVNNPDGTTEEHQNDEKGEVSFYYEGMDVVYDVEVKPYERNIPLNMYIDGGSSSGIAVTFGSHHDNQLYTELKNGRQTVNVSPLDFPIHVHESGAKVYVNGTQVPEQGNHDFITEAPAAGSDVRIFSRVSSTYPVTINNSPSSTQATYIVDGKEVQPGSSFIALPGTEIVVTPKSSAATMMLQTGLYSWLEPTDGKFVFSPKGATELTLRPKAVATVVCDNSWETFELTSKTSGEVYRLQGKTTNIVLPYVAGATSTTVYQFEVSDPASVMRIASVSGTNCTLNGNVISLRNNSTITLTAEKNPKPYYLNIHVAHYENAVYLNPKEGKYFDVGEIHEECSNFYVTNSQSNNNDSGGGFGGGTDYSEEPTPMPFPGPNPSGPSFNYYLRYGDNNYYRDYRLHDSEDENSSSGPPKYVSGLSDTFNEFFNLTAEQFPVTIHNDNYGTMYIINGNKQKEVVYGQDYVIECPTDGYKIDIVVSENDVYTKSVEFIGMFYSYQISGGEEHIVDSSCGTVSDAVYDFNTIKLRPVDGVEISSIICNDSALDENSSDSDHYYKDEDGSYIVAADYFTYSNNPTIEVTVNAPSISIEYDEINANITVNGQKGPMADGTGDILLPNMDDVRLSCDPGYRIISVVDQASGNDLSFDAITGRIYGLTDGMELYITVEKYERSHTLTAVFYGNGASPTATGNATLILAPGTMQERENPVYAAGTQRNTRQIMFSPNDAPFVLKDATYKLNSATVQDKVYLNNVEIPFVNGAYQFPGEVPDGSTLIILRPAANAVSDVKAIAEIESGLKVDVTVGGRPAGDLSGFTVPVTAAVKVTEIEGNEFDFMAEYSLDGGATWTVIPAAGYDLKTTDKQLKIRAAKTYNTLTVNAAEGTDLSDLKFTDGDVEYELNGGTLAVPTRVNSIMITTSKPDSYVEATVGQAVEGMEFDKDHGILSGISTAEIEVSTKTVVRDHEVKVFLDNEDFNAGSLVLGGGKVIESSASLSEGYQSVQFSEEDLPLVYRIAPTTGGEEGDDFIGDSTFDPSKPETMPAVFVNGEQLEYSPEHGGYIFPVEALTGDVPPVIKIYAPAPQTGAEGDDPSGEPAARPGVNKISVFYLVENGVKFEAVEDYATAVTEAGIREVLPSTLIELTATSENGDDLYVEVDGERTEPVDGKYTIMTGNTDVTIAVKLVKLEITVTSDDWQTVRVIGNGFSYPMYDATSRLEFPQSTQSVVLFNEKEGSVITAVQDLDGNDCEFNSATGELKVTDKMNVTLVMGDYTRDVELLVYVEEDVDEQQITHLILAEGTTVEKAVELHPGYQTVRIHQSDLPLAVTTAAEADAKVYLGSTQIAFNGSAYEFPATLEDKSVVKIYTDEQPVIKLNYQIDLKGYDFIVWHDTQADVAVSTDEEHSVLPGTEISFMITPQTEQTVLSKARKAPESDPAADNGPVVTVNDEDITPDSEGVYTIKANASHADSGISIKAVTPAADPDDPNTAVDEIVADDAEVDVYNVNGVLILKGAGKDDISKLPAGVYIIGGQKKVVR